MKTIQNIRTIRTRNFTVRVDAVEDSDLDLSFDDDGSVRRGLESGELMAFGVVVKVCFRGAEVGQDSLWNCIYSSPTDFQDHLGLRAKSRKDGRNYGSYFVGMIHSAIEDARKRIAVFKTAPIRENLGTLSPLTIGPL